MDPVVLDIEEKPEASNGESEESECEPYDHERSRVAVMRLAPINTDLTASPTKVLDETYYEAFHKYPRAFYKTSLDMGCSFVTKLPRADMVGSGTAIKKILMEPYAAGPLSLICHRIGKTVYLDSYIFTRKTNPGSIAHIWEFHDYRMLVDVDLPIFGCGKFPNVSIHISEEAKPISVLTGVDVLLDQLICNLSETILVHHERGLVKEYEVLVKEEIPHIVGSEFDPMNLKNITENIMSFLSNNMTEQGHTYWLFRGERGSSHLKLYDLTSLCPDLACAPNWNPFLVPVITLLYKLSTHLIEKSPRGRSDKLSNVIYGLLSAAAKLAEHANLAEMKSCVHYSLAGVYLMYGLGEEASKSDELSHLLEGLDDVLTSGSYPRLTSTIQVDYLKRRSSYDEVQSLIPPPDNNGIRRPPHVRIRPDGADDIAAVKSVFRVVLSTNPEPRHNSVCHALMSSFLSSFIHSAAKRVEDKMDTLVNGPLPYRDRRILELATAGVTLRGIFDCSDFWFERVHGEVRRTEWFKQIEAAIERDYPNPHCHVAYPPTVSIIAPASNICRVAMAVMMLAGMHVASARGELDQGCSLYYFYTKNDEICSSYRKIFALLNFDIETSNGGSIYINSLLDFGCALFIFADHLKRETEVEWKEMRMHYLEASIRALQDVYNKKGYKMYRSKASQKMIEAYYTLLALKSEAISSRPEVTSVKSQRAVYKELAEIISSAQNHIIDMSYEDLNPECKNIPLSLADPPTMLVTVKYVSESTRIHISTQMLQWTLALTSNIRSFEPDPSKAMEYYRSVWSCVQCMLRTMNQEWRNNPTMKKAYMHVLVILPKDPDATRSLMIGNIRKAIETLSGGRAGNSH
ncbi:hypothetical protein DICVIV_11475 [Dictyocaulus viviparus]|uniref:EDRF1 N-terminal domain-containing protein n=1 Tax=Dictyocaulus viviparus TaxID=29172 RepID=A0A0D8XD28_DICVI|nr:hypothetical protein DICVIV_11475 [Dictyocaulus viviparus]